MNMMLKAVENKSLVSGKDYTLYVGEPKLENGMSTLIPITEQNFVMAGQGCLEVAKERIQQDISPILTVDTVNDYLTIILTLKEDEKGISYTSQQVIMDPTQFPNGVKSLLGMIDL